MRFVMACGKSRARKPLRRNLALIMQAVSAFAETVLDLRVLSATRARVDIDAFGYAMRRIAYGKITNNNTVQNSFTF